MHVLERIDSVEEKNIYKIIAEYRNRMSKSQHKIADYVLDNIHSVAFLTGAKLAEAVGVSEATIVRFANFIGFSGYNDFQKNLAHSVEKQLNTVDRLKMSRSVHSKSERSIYDIFEGDIQNIQATMNNLDHTDIENAAEKIVQAKRIYIIANRSAVSLGTFLQYYLDLLFGKSELIHTTASAFDRIHNVDENDVVIGISFARYTQNTLDVVSYADERGANIIALTDEYTSPITAYADISLFASSSMSSFLDSFVAPFSLINVLIAYLGNHKSIDIDERFQNFENLWNRYNVFFDETEYK